MGLNRVISKVVSSMTAALRFDGELNVDMNEFQTNLVPFPRLHFMTTSLAPVATEEKNMAISLNFRGAVKSKGVNETIQKVKKQNKVSFVEWMPTGFKVGLNKEVAAGVENDPLADSKNSVVMIGNNIAINRVFSDRLSKKYDMMYSQRAYVHWYVGEGME